MGPQQQRVSSFNHQINRLPHRQADFGGDMAKGQIGQHGHFELGAQPIDHALKFETLVMWRQFVLGELAQHQRFLLRQHAGVQQLGSGPDVVLDTNRAFMACGQAAGAVKEIVPARQVVEEFMEGCRRAIDRMVSMGR